MIADLMSTQTSDGIRLDGAFFAPDPSARRLGPVDAVLLSHRSSVNFYAPATRFMADDLRNQGIATLALNTAAHDTVWVDMANGQFRGIAFNGCPDGRRGVFVADLGELLAT